MPYLSDERGLLVKYVPLGYVRYMSQFGQTVRLLRKGNGMSLQALATAAGTSKSYVWDIEQGRTDNPTVALLLDLSAALGVPSVLLFEAASRQ